MLGTEPQDLSFTPEKSRPLVIGNNNHFKEGVNISRGVKSEAGSLIGDGNYLMGNFHAGHDCIIGDNNILGHGSVLAGHVTIGNHVFVSGIAAIHQFSRIGDRAMIAGCAKIVKDVPPFSTADGNPARLKRLKVRFSKPVRPGETVTTQAWKTGDKDGVTEYGFRVVNDKGDVVVTDGIAEVAKA